MHICAGWPSVFNDVGMERKWRNDFRYHLGAIKRKQNGDFWIPLWNHHYWLAFDVDQLHLHETG